MTGDFSLIASSLLLWGFGEGLFFYFLPLSLQDLNASPILIGISLGGMGFFSILTQIPSGYLSDRIGPKYILWAAWIVGIMATVMMAFASSLWFFIAGLWLYYFTGFTIAPLNSLVVQVKGRMRIERAVTFISGMYSLGAVAGPFIGGRIVDRWGLSAVYKVAALFFIISSIIIFFIKKSKPSFTHVEKFKTHLFSNHRFLFYLGLVFLVIFFTYLPQPLTSNFLKNQASLSPALIGLLGTIANLGSTFFTLVLGMLRMGAGLLLGQLSMLLFSAFLLRGETNWMFGIGFFLLGGFRLTRNMLVAAIRSYAGDKELGLAFGMFESMAGLAVLSAPILAGALYRNEPRTMYVVGIFGTIFSILLTILFLLIQKRSSSSNKGKKDD